MLNTINKDGVYYPRDEEDLEHVLDHLANSFNNGDHSSNLTRLSLKEYTAKSLVLTNELTERISNEFFKGVEDLDVSNIEDFSCCFSNITFFNRNLSKWDVSKGMVFTSMFLDCIYLDQSFRGWNINREANIDYMFYGCSKLDGEWCDYLSVPYDQLESGTFRATRVKLNELDIVPL